MIKRSLFAEPSDLTHKKNQTLITNRVCPEVDVLMISHKHSAQFCLHASSVSHVCPWTVKIIPSWRTTRVFWTLFVIWSELSVEEKSPLPGKRMHPLLRHANTDLDQSSMVLLDGLPTEPHQQTHIKRKSQPIYEHLWRVRGGFNIYRGKMLSVFTITHAGSPPIFQLLPITKLISTHVFWDQLLFCFVFSSPPKSSFF